ncbi:MAG TPA: hypothetical protein VMT46_13610 [Anaerolineaceae bacterium]|nr:hypothetical protein [Anaerolineaceae bacterium]
MKVKFAIWCIVALIGLTSLPYWIAVQTTGKDQVFGGFLYNPIDGNSYLAKMEEGRNGSWQFSLPFTAEQGGGSYLFLFYLFLGHVSTWTRIQPIWIFHIARVLAAMLLGLALWKFLNRFVPVQATRVCYALALFGAGLGWIGLFFGQVTSDLTIPEAYPFLSSFANPHFPLSLALILFLFLQRDQPSRIGAMLVYLLGGLALASLLPFGAVLVVLVTGGLATWDFFEKQPVHWYAPALTAIGAGPMLVYQLAATRLDPLLAVWNAQNNTPSPGLLDFLLSFSPAIILAIPGAITVIRHPWKEARVLLVWTVIGLALTYTPFSLQRRFLLGLYIPLVGLAGIGLSQIFATQTKKLKTATALTLGVSYPTSLLVLVLGIFGALHQDPLLYYSRAEQRGFDWLRQTTRAGAVVLAGPETSLFIPAQANRRVVYAHPFETVHAEQKKEWVLSFYRNDPGQVSQQALEDHRVNYVWIGPREIEAGGSDFLLDLPVVYQRDGIKIFQVQAGR